MAILQEGRFTSTGQNILIPLPAGADWIRVYNTTALITTTVDLPFEFYFQNGMVSGTGIQWEKLGATDANDSVTVGAIPANGGFVFVNTSVNPFGSPVAVTNISNAQRPIITTASTVGLTAGSIVRFSGLTAQGFLGNIDWTVGVVTDGTHFTLASLLADAGVVAAAGNYRTLSINNVPYPLFYPSTRVIVNMAPVGNQTQIFMNMPSGYKVGQSIRIDIPNVTFNNGAGSIGSYGVPQMNQVQCTVSDVTHDGDLTGGNALSILVNVPFVGTFFTPTSAAFAASGPFVLPTVTPIGEDTAYAIANGLNILSDATVNQGQFGFLLLGGAAANTDAGPAGGVGDVMYWQAGTADYINNQ